MGIPTAITLSILNPGACRKLHSPADIDNSSGADVKSL